MTRKEKEDYLVTKLAEHKLIEDVEGFRIAASKFSDSVLDVKIEMLDDLIEEGLEDFYV